MRTLVLLLFGLLLGGCGDRSLGLPDEPYLYSCVQDGRIMVFDLKHLGNPLEVGDATYVSWAGQGDFWRAPGGVFFDVKTLERFSVPTRSPGCGIHVVIDGNRFIQACSDDPSSEWAYSTVDRSGNLIQDHGLAIGGTISPDHQRVFGLMPLLPGGGFWVFTPGRNCTPRPGLM
jgi:hypothetical protein